MAEFRDWLLVERDNADRRSLERVKMATEMLKLDSVVSELGQLALVKDSTPASENTASKVAAHIMWVASRGSSLVHRLDAQSRWVYVAYKNWFSPVFTWVVVLHTCLIFFESSEVVRRGHWVCLSAPITSKFSSLVPQYVLRRARVSTRALTC